MEAPLRLLPEGEVPLLGKDLRGRRSLRPVGHLAGGLDLLAELSADASLLLEEAGPRGIEVGDRFHCDIVAVSAGRRVPFYAPPARRQGPVMMEDRPMAIAIDPVCGMEVDTATATLTSEHEGTTYYFCGKGCKLDFEDEPEKFLDPEYTPQGM